MSGLFEEISRQGHARRGRMRLSHGVVETPVFMPVGTYGVVKTLSSEELTALGSQIILGNTYHLYLRPGLQCLEKFGGLHQFMHWNGPILSDSGGFQVFSLGKLLKLTDEGAQFRSHLNGDLIFLTPELSAQIQQTIGSDIAMVLDECPALPADERVIRGAVERSLAWARRFLDVPRKKEQKIFGILQGGTSFALRKYSLEETLRLDIDGISVGGLSVGEPHHAMVETLDYLAPLLPKELPHYLMGVGTPRDILEAVNLGIDMFDCVLPTRNARNGSFFTDEGLLHIRNSTYRLDTRPIDEACSCDCCTRYSRAYLRHLFQIKEILGCRLATVHNLHYYHRLMSQIRSHLEAGDFPTYYRALRERFIQAYPEVSHA